MHNMYINRTLYTVSTATCFNASASSSGSLNLVLANVTKLLKLQLSKIIKLVSFNDDRVNILIY